MCLRSFTSLRISESFNYKSAILGQSADLLADFQPIWPSDPLEDDDMQTGREGDEDGEGGRGGVVDHADAVRSLQLIASAGILVAHGHAFWNVDASRLVHEGG